MSIKVTQHSFAGGQLDRALLGGRQDLQKYFTGATTLINYLVGRQGCLTKRPGTDFCFDAYTRINYYDNNNAMTTTSIFSLVPFIFEQSYGYAILFTPGRITIYAMNGAAAQEIDTSPYNDTIPDLGFCQSGDVLFITSKYHVPHRLIRSAAGVFTLEAIIFSNTLTIPSITSIVLSGNEGTPDRTIAYCVTAVYKNGESLPSTAQEIAYKAPWASGQLITVTMNSPTTDPLPLYYNIYKKTGSYFGLIGCTLYNPTMIITSASSVAVTPKVTNATNATLFYIPLFASNAASTALIAPTKMPKWGYKRGAVVHLSGNLEINLTAPTAFNKIRIGIGYACSRKFRTNPMIASYWRTCLYATMAHKHSVEITFSEGDPVTLTSELFDQIAAGQAFTEIDQVNPAQVNWPNPAAETAAWTTITAGAHKEYIDINMTTGNELRLATKIVIKGWTDTAMTAACTGDIVITEQDSAAPFTGYHDYIVSYTGNPMIINGVELFAIGGQRQVFTDDYITPNVAVGIPKQTELFKPDGELPGLVALYQQRLMFASSNANPSKYWLSRPGNFLDFSTSEIITEADPIIASLPLTKGPRICHIVAQRDAHCFCEGSEWVIRAVNSNTLSYKTITADMQSASGCSEWLPPIMCGTSMLFVEKSGRSVREYKYDYASDGFAGRDISIMSASLFEGRQIVDWAYQQHPDSILWCVMSDGALLGFTYMPEHEVYAWFQAEMENATVLSICGTEALIGYDDKLATSEIFLLVKRDTSYYIERMRPTPAGETLLTRAIHLDCVTLFTRPHVWSAHPPTGFTAINVETGEIVTDLVEGDSYIQGIPIKAELTTVHPEIPGQGTIQNTIKAVVSAQLRVQNAEGLNVRLAIQAEAKDQDVRDCEETITPAVSPATEATVALKDGDFEVIPEQANSPDGRITITDNGLFGSTILSVSTNLSIQPIDGMEG